MQRCKKGVIWFFNLIKIFDLNTRLAKLVTKAELKAEQDKIMKFQAIDSGYFLGYKKLHFQNWMATCFVVY